MATVLKPQIKNIDYGKLTPAGHLFLDHRWSVGGTFEITRIDLGRYPDGGGGRYHDDLRFPFVVMRSKIPMSERMRRCGAQSVGYGNDSGRRGPEGYPIPTEDYIAALVRCYGDRVESRSIDLEPYAARVVRGRMSLEDAVNAAGETILHLMDGGGRRLDRPAQRFLRSWDYAGLVCRESCRGSAAAAKARNRFRGPQMTSRPAGGTDSWIRCRSLSSRK
jgi:hypothetical protein